MCGILVTARSKRPFRHRDLDSLKRRGPDALGFWTDGLVNIAQTRLAVIGLGDRGNEPMDTARYVVAYNGEIYNFEAIRRRLESDGTSLRGANDAEVLLEAWERWGPAVITDLSGFWAFVIYDRVAGSLTLVRDQIGVKPLYYAVHDGEICVASMLRTILEASDTPSVPDYEALSEYAAYQFTFGDKTFIRDVKKVQPGHIVTIDIRSGTVSSTCYEDILAPDESMGVTIDRDWIEETRGLLVDCVIESTVGDVPFATLCSGGIDSSLITRVAQPEIAYHCNYSDPDCNETFFARQAVDGTATRLFVTNALESFDLVKALQSIVEDFDELSIGSVVLPLDDLLAQVRRRHKVVLTGTGGDELFGGYVRYQLALGNCFQDSYRGLFETMRGVSLVSDRFEVTHRKGKPEYFRFYSPDVEATFRKVYDSCLLSGDHVHAMLTFDRRFFLAGLLNIDDKMAARHSVESRPSLLHQRMVRHVNRVAPASLIEGRLKGVLREIAEPLLPAAITHRADKMGFTTPIGTFVQRSFDLVREQLSGSRFRDLYDLTYVNLSSQDKYSRHLFGLLMVDLWLNRYVR